MNYKERQSINNIEDAKRDIKNAKLEHEKCKNYMDNMALFIESNIKVDTLKNVRQDIKTYQNNITKNNQELDNILKNLDKEINNIRQQVAERDAMERAEVEKKRLEKEEKNNTKE